MFVTGRSDGSYPRSPPNPRTTDRSIVCFIAGRGYLRRASLTNSPSGRCDTAPTANQSRERYKKNPPGPGRKCVLKPVCVSPNTTTTSSSSGTSLTSPVCFPRRPPAARYSSSHERNGAAAADCGVYGRWSCRFLLHLSVPEGLQTLCTEFGGVAQNAKWTLQPRACVRVRGQSDPMASCPSARP